MRSRFLLAVGIGLALLPASSLAEVKLPPVLSSHMVLQREMPVPVWGTAAPGEKIVVKFRDQEKSITASPDGKWLVKLDALKAGGPDVLTVSGSNTIKLDDVLVGEVWVGSGQSNMAGGVANYAKNDPVLAKLAEGAPYPRVRLIKARGVWQESSPTAVNGHSALLFSFGVRLQQELGVPVGLMLGAVGGTPSGFWISEENYAASQECKDSLARFTAHYPYDQLKKKYDLELAQYAKDAEAARKANKPEPKKPVPPSQPGEARGKIGHLYEANIRPYVPFAIRGVLWDQGEGGTGITGVDQFTLMGALIGGWRKDWGQGAFPFLCVQKPSGGGPAWDPNDPVTNKADKFAPLPATPPATVPSALGEFLRLTKHPHTGLVVCSDLGPGVHPSNKSGYGTRAARLALGMVYDRKLETYGPTYQSHQLEGSKVRVRFSHVGQGLAFKHGEKLQGFAVAGEDKVFHWADAAIDGDAVVLTCAAVKQPVAIRYAWAMPHPWANLFNKDGLPALPFRTDE